MKKKLVLMAFVSILLLSAVPAGNYAHRVTSSLRVQSGTDWWSMFHHNPRHTGYSTSTAPNNNNTVWIYHTGSSVRSSPAVVDGKVFVGSDDGNIYALDASTGTKIWNTTLTPDYVSGSPAVANSRIFVWAIGPGWFHHVFALNETTGDKLWNFTMNYGSTALTTALTVSNGRVFVGPVDGNVYALNETTGAPIWSYPAEEIATGPASSAVASGVVFVGSGDGNVLALNETTGEKMWNYTTASWFSSPAVSNGKVFVASDQVYALNASTGEKLWNFTTSSLSCPAVANGLVFVGSLVDGKTYALNETTGELIWSSITGNITLSSPALADGKVFIGEGGWGPGHRGVIYALHEASGAIVWTYKTQHAKLFSSPAIASGKVFIGSGEGNVYCFGPSPVGGIYIPVNKLELLAPYIGLTILLAVAVITVGYVKKRKRDTN